MSKYARVENGMVREIIDFNPEGRFTQEIVSQFVKCDDSVKQHFTYSNNEFHEPVPPEIVEVKQPSLEEQLNSLKSQMLALEEQIQSQK
jgi:hypothetical protein